jgi:type II secretory pathway component PulJ
VVYSSTGEAETVQYQKPEAVLLNEVQKQHRDLEKQKHDNAELKARLEVLERLVVRQAVRAQK